MTAKTVLTIARSNSSGGTGIQVDVKTMTAHGVYVMGAITVLTAQNITGVTGIMEVTPSFLKERLDDIFMDIFLDAAKTGVVSSGGLIEAIGDGLALYRVANAVVDPAMVSTGDSRLISSEAIKALKEVLLPMVDLLIPNIPEAKALPGVEIHNPGDMETAARATGEDYGHAVLFKGGYQLNNANDLLYRDKKLKWPKGGRINSPNTHGTGCTLSSVIASNLTKGMDMDLAMERVEVYPSGALEVQPNLGKGSGSMNYGFAVRGGY